MIYTCIRSFLFRLDPERSHALALNYLKWCFPPWRVNARRKRFPDSPVKLWGLTFPNPIGLAAGLDKNGEYVDALFGLGFGFVEIGTVTPEPQAGNPTPRLFRIPEARALINRLGFNSRGVDYVIEQLKKRKIKGILGVNLGKNQMTSNENAFQDYQVGFEKVYPYADYVTINISSPNTPRLRDLQTEAYLSHLLKNLKECQLRLQKKFQRYVPLLIKISPDLTDEEINVMADEILAQGMDGVIATNTTRHRYGVEGLAHAGEEGGLSGEPLFPVSLRLIKCLRQALGDGLPIVAVGGVMSPEQADQFLNSGANLVQIYTGLIYQGPKLISSCIKKVHKMSG